MLRDTGGLVNELLMLQGAEQLFKDHISMPCSEHLSCRGQQLVPLLRRL